MGNPQFGAGMHAGIAIGRQQKTDEIIAAVAAAKSKQKAQQKANVMDATAEIIGSTLAGLIPVVYGALKDRHQQKKTSVAL